MLRDFLTNINVVLISVKFFEKVLLLNIILAIFNLLNLVFYFNFYKMFQKI